MTPTVDSDDPKTFGKEKQHLVIPVVGAQGPAVMKDYRLSFLWTPVFEVNVDAVLGGDKCHVTDSSFRITSLQARAWAERRRRPAGVPTAQECDACNSVEKICHHAG